MTTRYQGLTLDELAALAVDGEDSRAALLACQRYFDETGLREDRLNEAKDDAVLEATRDLEAKAEKMEELLNEATHWFKRAFERNEEVSGADLLDLFAEWRRDVLKLLETDQS